MSNLIKCISCNKPVDIGRMIISNTGNILFECKECRQYWEKFNRVKQKQLRAGIYKGNKEIEKLIGRVIKNE